MSKDAFYEDRYETPDRETVLEAENKRLKARIEELEAFGGEHILQDKLVEALCDDLLRRPESTRIVMGNRSYNGTELAEALREMTPDGYSILIGALMLAIDLHTRGREKLPDITSLDFSEWRYLPEVPDTDRFVDLALEEDPRPQKAWYSQDAHCWCIDGEPIDAIPYAWRERKQVMMPPLPFPA